MRADGDFMVYVAARWPALVREAVLLGCPPEQAADAATEALSRCRRDWGRTSREENVDRLVHDELVDATHRRPQTDPAPRATVAEELLVLAPPTLDDLDEHQRRRDAANRRRALVVAVPVLLLVAGIGTYAAVGGGTPAHDPDELEQVSVERVANPAPGVVWYADGELHLDNAVLGIDGITDMTRLGTGVVYGDEEGRVVYAADDGSRTLLGHKEAEVPVAATDENGLAAWFDPETEEVHVVEAATGNVRLHSKVDDRPEVVAVDGDAVYLVGADGARALLPTGPTSEIPVSPVGLLDVRSRIRVFQKDATTIQVVQSAFNAVFDLAGRGADLSPDGTLVATRSPVDGALVLYDTRSGLALGTGLAPGERLLAAAPGDRGRVAYVAVPATGGDAELRTCVLALQSCTVAAEIPGPDDPPVLAR